MSESQIKISIIVPCYKVEKYLPRCLDSLVGQTLSEIEIVCINDGSPDNCLNILKEYQQKHGDKIVIIDKQNEGVWRGRKDGIAKAQGEFIGFVDSDDYVALDFAEKLYAAAKQNAADIVVCGFDRIDLDTGNLYSREMTKFPIKTFDIQENPGLLLEVNAAPWNKIYKSELLKNMGNLETIPRVFDDMMFLQLIYINANRITFIDDSLVYYMVRKDSIINTINQKYIDGVYESMKELKTIYESNNSNMLNYIDSCAFLHLGISFMYRLYADKELDFGKALKTNTTFINTYFPNWNNEYITLKFILKNKGANKKLYIGKKFYDFHIFRLFLKTYTFMINSLGVDIKW